MMGVKFHITSYRVWRHRCPNGALKIGLRCSTLFFWERRPRQPSPPPKKRPCSDTSETAVATIWQTCTAAMKGVVATSIPIWKDLDYRIPMPYTACQNSIWVETSETLKFAILGLECCNLLLLLLLLLHPTFLISGFQSSSHTFRVLKFYISLPYNIL